MFGTSPLFYADNQSNGKINQLLQIDNSVTFFKDYQNSRTSLNADYSAGSPTATFASARSASNPATYIDSHGVINLVTSADTPRNQSGYYDATGFHSLSGLMLEVAGTNLLTRTDGTAYSTGLWTNWFGANGTYTGVRTNSNVDIPELTSITNSKSQRCQYTANIDDTGATLYLSSPLTAVGSVVQNDTVTISCWARSQTGNTGITLTLSLNSKDSSNVVLTEYNSSALTLTSVWNKFIFTTTITDATSSLVQGDFGDGVGTLTPTSAVDFEIWGMQIEVNAYATSFIPTTTTALDRADEFLSYKTLGNRTVTSESLFIKTAPFDIKFGGLINSDTKERFARWSSSTSKALFYPNFTDNVAVVASAPNAAVLNTSTVVAAVMKHSSPYVVAFSDGVAGVPYTAGDWTDPSWGDNWQPFDSNAEHTVPAGVLQSITIYSTARSDADVLAITNIFN